MRSTTAPRNPQWPTIQTAPLRSVDHLYAKFAATHLKEQAAGQDVPHFHTPPANRTAIDVLTDIGKDVFDAARCDTERQTLKPKVPQEIYERGIDANDKLLQHTAVLGKGVRAPIPCSIRAKSR
jgi:hypothetical protein